jgi:sarcosine oxidase, subunit gamma
VTADELGRSPLVRRMRGLASVGERTGGGVILEHVPFLAQVDVRLGAADLARAPYPLPAAPNTAWEDGPRAALWLGPDEWLVLGPPGAGPAIEAELETALDGLHRSIVDVSANRVALELSGPRAMEILSKGCAFDLHPRTWQPGMCAQTMLARAQVILHERATTTGILVRPSFADYLVDWLIDASSMHSRDTHSRT